MKDISQQEARVDSIIVNVLLPKCYEAMAELIDLVGHDNISKTKLIAYRRLLPGQYRNSFEGLKA